MTMRASAYIIVLLLALSGASASRELMTEYTTGGTCKATAWTGKYAVVEDAWAKAVTRAVLVGCSVDDNVSAKILIRKFKSSFADWAKAAVNVYAFAFSKCTTLDGTAGCAAAEAHASKMATARAGAYAKAFAFAANKCPDCDPIAIGKVVSKLIIEITAQAKVHVSTAVCITGDGTVVAKARKECWAEATAWAAAYSLAKALISGSCLDQKAHIKVDTYLKVNTNPTLCACEGWKSTGNGREPIWFPNEDKHCEFHEYQVFP